jgi:hypothetical protein
MSFVIPSRFCGPPESGNGGWVSGHLAQLAPGGAAGEPVSVRLSSPPPLDRAMRVQSEGDVRTVFDGDLKVAQAQPADAADFARDGIPSPVTYAAALAAAAGYDGLRDHPFPTCFSCGTAREPGDALCLRPGPVEGTHVHAAAWVPTEVAPEIVWAALDCPGAWALGVGGRPMVLGTMTASIDRLPTVGQEHVVVAWALGSEGRKHRCGTALFHGGELLAHAEATWIAVDPTSIRPA